MNRNKLENIDNSLFAQSPGVAGPIHDGMAQPICFRLDFDDRSENHLVNFFEPETAEGHVFRWSEPVAMVRLDVLPGDYHVEIDTAGLRGESCPFDFNLLWNDQKIPRNSMEIRDGKIMFCVDRSMFLRNDEQRMTISCKPLNAENGRRQLGLPIKTIKLVWIEDCTSDVANRKRSRSRPWRHVPSFHRFRRLLGRKSPSPTLPIWEMKLPSLATMPHAAGNDLDRVYPPAEIVVVSSVEINSRHGTGLLIQYLFDDLSKVATVSSLRCYDGDRVRSAVHHDLPSRNMARHEIYDSILNWFRNSPPRKAYVVPFFKSDLMMAIALKDLFGARVCLHFMDDNNLYANEIPGDLMTEALEKADLLFAISSEMRNAYEQRYGRKMYLLPPIVPDHLILREAVPYRTALSTRLSIPKSIYQRCRAIFTGTSARLTTNSSDSSRGILIGNVWDQKWLDMLRATVRDSGFEIDWYSNNPDAVWLNQQLGDLAKDGIFLKDALWGEELANELRRRPYALMPSGTLCPDEPRESIARLSLPSRIPFVVAAAQIPVIVLGNEQTVAARFVDRFQLGCTVDYNSQQFRKAVQHVLSPRMQQGIRHRASEIAMVFSAKEMENWLWHSLEVQQPIDDRFEKLFAIREGEFAYYINSSPPGQVHWDKHDLWKMLKRLQCQGIRPDTIIDVGASTGVWSWTAAKVFPNAHYVLIDPMLSRYSVSEREFYQRGLPKFQIIEAALGNQTGEAELLVSNDLYGSSLLKINQDIRRAEKVRVDILRLDDLARRHCWKGSTLLKIDVQFAEHLVIAGGLDFIRSNVDALLLELTLEREHPQAKTYREMLDWMEELGFQLIDETEGWRSPKNGRLEQKDALFLRREMIAQSRAA
jgi:FkbM family methyltransferase